PFGDSHRLPAGLVGEQVPDQATARDAKEPQLPVGSLAVEELDHPLRVVAGSPFRFCHARPSLRPVNPATRIPDSFTSPTRSTAPMAGSTPPQPTDTSFLAQYEIERPTSPDVRPRRAQMREDFGVGAIGLFEGIGENGEVVEGPLRIDRTSHVRD